jgi:hypothetical protein
MAQTREALRQKRGHATGRGHAMTMTHDRASADWVARQCAYNLFRNKQRPKLVCAVPEDRPVPGFIVPEAWLFERILRSQDAAPSGFHDRAAHAGVRYNGFYLFQVTARERAGETP